jgi:hypothetical protein
MVEHTSVMNLQPNREPFEEIALIIDIGLQFMMNGDLLMQ